MVMSNMPHDDPLGRHALDREFVGHGHLSARILLRRRFGQGYYGSLLAWDEKRPRPNGPDEAARRGPGKRGADAEARDEGRVALPQVPTIPLAARRMA